MHFLHKRDLWYNCQPTDYTSPSDFNRSVRQPPQIRRINKFKWNRFHCKKAEADLAHHEVELRADSTTDYSKQHSSEVLEAPLGGQLRERDADVEQRWLNNHH